MLLAQLRRKPLANAPAFVNRPQQSVIRRLADATVGLIYQNIFELVLHILKCLQT